MWRNVLKVLVPMTLIAVMTACGDPVPVEEMAKARQMIDAAENVKADVYAPEEIADARAKLKDSHSSMAEAETKEAAERAVQSRESALAAYNKAVPQLAADSIEEAETSIARAEKAYAEELAAEDFNAARESLSQAQASKGSEKYYQSYEEATQARNSAERAYARSISQKQVLMDAIREVDLILEKAENYDAPEYADAHYERAKTERNNAAEAYRSEDLKEGFASIEVARINAEEAYREAMKGTAGARLEEADANIAAAESSKGAGIAGDELDAARTSRQKAGEFYHEERYQESIVASEESMRYSQVVTATTSERNQDLARVNENTQPGGSVSSLEETDEYWVYEVKYREKYKDCLWRIAGQYYKNPRFWKRIYNANRDRIKNPDVIVPGWKLKIPKPQ